MQDLPPIFLAQRDLQLNRNIQDGNLSIGDTNGLIEIEMVVMKKGEGR